MKQLTEAQLNEAVRKLRGECPHSETKIGYSDSPNTVPITVCAQCGMEKDGCFEWERWKDYCNDIEAAMTLLQSSMMFSQRQRMFHELQRLISASREFQIAWPYAMIFMKPEHIAAAYHFAGTGERVEIIEA